MADRDVRCRGAVGQEDYREKVCDRAGRGRRGWTLIDTGSVGSPRGAPAGSTRAFRLG